MSPASSSVELEWLQCAQQRDQQIQQDQFQEKKTNRSSQDFLLAYPSGAYTTMRTVGRKSVLELQMHLDRIRDTMQSRGEHLPASADLLNLIQRVTQTSEFPADMELKITILAFSGTENNQLRLMAHCCPLPQLEFPEGKVTVEIHGAPRANANSKNSEWIRERERQSKQIHPETHEVLLFSPDTLDIYEGKSSNFFIVDADGSVCCAPLETILVGTILKLVLEVCEQLEIPIRYQFPNASHIFKWQAAFITSTSRSVLPIDQIWAADGDKPISIPSSQCAILQRIREAVAVNLVKRSSIPDPLPAVKRLHQIKEALGRYLALDRDFETRSQVENIYLNDPDSDELSDRLLNRLTFGTAGLRAAMGGGFGRMNGLTVIQATQGLVEYLQKIHSQEQLTAAGVVIGHDHRHHSDQFARLTAAVFLSANIRVHYYDNRLVHTPAVPYAVRKLCAICGVMITASHNPKNDNGYKLYWSNACQVISPHDKRIQEAIERNQTPRVWDLSLVDSHPLTHSIPTRLEDEYYDEIKQALHWSLEESRSLSASASVKLVYTAMHGVGYPFARRLFSELSLPDLYEVAEQIKPDPDFPTVKYPNPEEGAGALQLAIKRAESVGAQVIFANDPDADRLALAEQNVVGRQWKVFTGNEIGTLLGFYIFTRYLRHNPQCSKDKLAMLTTVVSSKFLRQLAIKEGFRFEETLTGFKWIGNRMLELESQGYRTLFAYEEAIGFMLDQIVPDKDGIGAMAALALAVYEIYRDGLDLSKYLEQIYQKYGYFYSINSYYFCYSPEKTREIFNRIRYRNDNANDEKNPSYPDSIGGYRVLAVRDLTIGYDSTTADCKATLPSSKSSQMIIFQVAQQQENGYIATVTLRTSGTEPKIKFYSEMTGAFEHRVSIQQALAELIDQMVDELLEPQRNGLIKKS